MKKYNFESVGSDTHVVIKEENSAYAIIPIIAALASTIVGESEEKKHELYRKMDQALEYNKDESSYLDIANIAKLIKASIS